MRFRLRLRLWLLLLEAEFAFVLGSVMTVPEERPFALAFELPLNSISALCIVCRVVRRGARNLDERNGMMRLPMQKSNEKTQTNEMRIEMWKFDRKCDSRETRANGGTDRSGIKSVQRQKH